MKDSRYQIDAYGGVPIKIWVRWHPEYGYNWRTVSNSKIPCPDTGWEWREFLLREPEICSMPERSENFSSLIRQLADNEYENKFDDMSEGARRDRLYKLADRFIGISESFYRALAPPPVGVRYDAGLLSDYGGGNVEWWQDYIRSELERAHDFYTAAFAQQPAAGEEIMVNAAHDVYTLPLQPSGLSSGPRFVVHVPAPEQPAPHPAITHCDTCGCDWIDNGLNPAWCPYCKQSAAVDSEMVKRAVNAYDEATGEGRQMPCLQGCVPP